MESYGIVVEGETDQAVFEELIQKICGRSVNIRTGIARGRAQLLKKAPGFLESFRYASPTGGPVEKALVVRDADCKDAAALEAQMTSSITQGRSLPFFGGVSMHAVLQEMETWLLADISALNRVAMSRGGKQVSEVRGSLER